MSFVERFILQCPYFGASEVPLSEVPLYAVNMSCYTEKVLVHVKSMDKMEEGAHQRGSILNGCSPPSPLASSSGKLSHYY